MLRRNISFITETSIADDKAHDLSPINCDTPTESPIDFEKDSSCVATLSSNHGRKVIGELVKRNIRLARAKGNLTIEEEMRVEYLLNNIFNTEDVYGGQQFSQRLDAVNQDLNNYNVHEDIEEEKDMNISSFRAMQEDIARRKRERNIDLILKQIQNAQTPFVVRGDSSARISNDDGSVPHYYNHRDIQAIHSAAKLEIEQHSCKLASEDEIKKLLLHFEKEIIYQASG